MRTLLIIVVMLVASNLQAQNYPFWLAGGSRLSESIEGTPDNFAILLGVNGGSLHSAFAPLPPDLALGGWGELSTRVLTGPTQFMVSPDKTITVEFDYEVRERAWRTYGDGTRGPVTELFDNVVETGTTPPVEIVVASEIVDPTTSPIAQVRLNPHPEANPWVEVTREAFTIDGFSVDLPRGFGTVDISRTIESSTRYFQYVTVPEPSSMLLLLIGIALSSWRSR